MKEQLNNNLVAANNHKQHLINLYNQPSSSDNPYYTPRVVNTKKKNKFCGINTRPNHYQHVEYDFHQQKFDNDMRNAEIAINNAQAAYD